MRLFVHSNEYTQRYDFACVFSCDSKGKIKYSVTKNVLQVLDNMSI